MFLMIRPAPGSRRTYTLLPYTSLFRSGLLLEAGCPGLGHIAVLPVGAVHCGQVARHAGLHLLDALGGLGYREVPVTVVDGLELAPVDGHDGPREQVELATQHDKLRAGRADRRAVGATEVGDRLKVWHQPR